TPCTLDLILPRPPRAPLLPYTPLFRSGQRGRSGEASLAFAALGLGGYGPREQVAAGAQHGRPHAGHGATRGPSRGSGAGARLRAPVPHGWLQGVYDRAAHPFRALGTAHSLPNHRADAQATLDVSAAAVLCAGDQDRAPPAAGAREPPRGVWHPGSRPTGACGVRLADQHSVYRAPQPVDAPACGRYWTARHHAVQTRGRRTPAARIVSCVL